MVTVHIDAVGKTLHEPPHGFATWGKCMAAIGRILTPGVRKIGLVAAVAAFAGFVASPARADRCDDSAKELANSIDKLKVNFKARNTVYMTHPLAKELSVACKGDKFAIELYAKGNRKPSPEFISLVGAMAAIVFTVTKDDTTTGATRCLKRMGLLRGNKITMRFRRLNLECERTKTEAWIAITRGKDE